MIGRSTYLGLAAAALMTFHMVPGGGAQVVGAPANYSSHDAAFFAGLLSGRVWLYERPSSRHADDRNTLWGSYYGPDGTVRSCIHLDGAFSALVDRWRIVPSRRFRALHNYHKAGTAPDPGRNKGHVPLFYDPGIGRLHTESLSASGREWFVLSLGWVQESWPRALRDACPGLDLPADLPVNERQTSIRMDEAIAQDPEAPLRGVPGSALAAPGSTGLALAGGGPTVTAVALKQFLIDNDGRVLETTTGARLVLVLGPERDELRRLDRHGALADTGYLLPSGDGAAIVLQWERLPWKDRYRIGDPFPLLPTGERYAAFRLMDWLVARQRDVGLPFLDREDVAFRFEPDGLVKARAADGGELPGRWWWSRGHLQVSLDGEAQASSYPWRALADRLGWTPASDGPADPAE